MDPITCPECSTVITGEATLCPGCGAALPDVPAPAEAAPETPAAPAGGALLKLPTQHPRWTHPHHLELIMPDKTRIPVECMKSYRVSATCAITCTVEDKNRRKTTLTLLAILLTVLGVFVMRMALSLLTEISDVLSAFVHPALWLVTLALFGLSVTLLVVPKDTLPGQLHFLLKEPAWLPGILRRTNVPNATALLLAAAFLFLVLAGAPILSDPTDFSWHYDVDYMGNCLFLALLVAVPLAVALLIRELFFRYRLARFTLLPGKKYRLFWAKGDVLKCEPCNN